MSTDLTAERHEKHELNTNILKDFYLSLNYQSETEELEEIVFDSNFLFIYSPSRIKYDTVLFLGLTSPSITLKTFRSYDFFPQCVHEEGFEDLMCEEGLITYFLSN